jgi:hypothetical protein
MHQDTRPMRVVASTARWRLSESSTIPVLAITNGRSRIFIAPEDLEPIARTLVAVLEQYEAGDAA